MPVKQFGTPVKETYSLDFTGVDVGRRRGLRLPPGDYVVKIKAVRESKTKESEIPQFNWTYVLLAGPSKGKELFDRTMIKGGGVFKLRTLMLACGVAAPARAKVKFSPKQLIGKVIGITVDDNEYNGTTTSQVVDYFPVKIKKDGSFKRLPLPDEDSEFSRAQDEDVEELDIDDDDEDEDEADDTDDEELDIDDDEDEDEEDEDEEDEDEEEEEPPPPPKKSKKGKK